MAQLRQMKIFVKLVETGQFTRASKQLAVSKSTVSKAVSDLEVYLGLQLVKRDGRSLQLTDAGHLYFTECSRLLAEISEVEDQVRGDNLGMSGFIRITAPTAFGNKTLAPLVEKFLTLHPKISLEIILTERKVDLVAEGIDVAFRFGALKDSDLLTRKIGTTRMTICAAPSYRDEKGLPGSFDELKDHNCLVYTGNPFWVFDMDGDEYRFEPQGNIRTNSGNNLREFVLAGVGIGFFPEYWIADDLNSGKLLRVLEGTSGDLLDIRVLRPAGRHYPARVRSFIDFIQAEMKSMTPKMTHIEGG